MHDQIGRPASILVIDDDPATRGTVADYLDERCLQVVCVARLDEACPHFLNGEPNLVLLDLARRHDDGVDLLRRIRSYSDVPVIVSGGEDCDELDRVAALDLGADDYLAKPYGLRELLARIHAVLRRDKAARGAPRPLEQSGYRFGGWQLDRRLRKLTNALETPVVLTKGEYDLLIAFLEAPQRPLTREYLAQATHMHGNVFDRSIDVQVMRLRRKLETDPSSPRLIETERNIGYVFTPTVERVDLR
jgi:two-component system, OmpR family, response regulator